MLSKKLFVTIILSNGWLPLSLGISHHESTYIMSIRIAADWKETLQNQNAGVRSVMTWEGFVENQESIRFDNLMVAM